MLRVADPPTSIQSKVLYVATLDCDCLWTHCCELFLRTVPMFSLNCRSALHNNTFESWIVCGPNCELECLEKLHDNGKDVHVTHRQKYSMFPQCDCNSYLDPYMQAKYLWTGGSVHIHTLRWMRFSKANHMKAPSASPSLSNVFLPFFPISTSASDLTHVHLMTEQQALVESVSCSSGCCALCAHVAADLMPTQAFVCTQNQIRVLLLLLFFGDATKMERGPCC